MTTYLPRNNDDVLRHITNHITRQARQRWRNILYVIIHEGKSTYRGCCRVVLVAMFVFITSQLRAIFVDILFDFIRECIEVRGIFLFLLNPRTSLLVTSVKITQEIRTIRIFILLRHNQGRFKDSKYCQIVNNSTTVLLPLLKIF